MSERCEPGTDGGEVGYNLLRAGVAQTMPYLDDPEVAALHAWSLVHGLAMLLIDGPLSDLGPAERETALERTLDLVSRGLATGPRGRATH